MAQCSTRIAVIRSGHSTGCTVISWMRSKAEGVVNRRSCRHPRVPCRSSETHGADGIVLGRGFACGARRVPRQGETSGGYPTARSRVSRPVNGHQSRSPVLLRPWKQMQGHYCQAAESGTPRLVNLSNPCSNESADTVASRLWRTVSAPRRMARICPVRGLRRMVIGRSVS